MERLNRAREDEGLWMPLPREVDAWWRERKLMKLSPSGENWRIEGPGSERARVAFAHVDDGRLVYEFDKDR